LLAIFSVSYLYDFVVGVIAFFLMTKIAEFNDKNKHKELDQENQNLLVYLFNF